MKLPFEKVLSSRFVYGQHLMSPDSVVESEWLDHGPGNLKPKERECDREAGYIGSRV